MVLIIATGDPLEPRIDVLVGYLSILFVKKDPGDLLSFYKGRALRTKSRRNLRPKPKMQIYKIPKR